MSKRNKYVLLTNHLKNDNRLEIKLTFEQIEKILGFELPTSSRKYKANWSNGVSRPLSRSWVEAGYHTELVDLENQVIIFAK